LANLGYYSQHTCEPVPDSQFQDVASLVAGVGPVSLLDEVLKLCKHVRTEHLQEKQSKHLMRLREAELQVLQFVAWGLSATGRGEPEEQVVEEEFDFEAVFEDHALRKQVHELVF